MNKKILLATMAAIPMYMGVVNAEFSQGIVTTTALNVRSGPSTSYSKKFVIYKGEKVTISDSSNGWYKITTQAGKTGWCSGSYIEKVASADIKVVTANLLNMRKGPSTSYDVITKIKNGEQVEVISAGKTWSKVTYKTYTGYVSNKYLADLGTNQETTTKKYVNTDGLNVRSGPGTSYKVLAVYDYGKAVEVVSVSDGWAKIKYGDGYAYLSDKYLSSKLEEENNSDKGITYTTKYENLSYSFDDMLTYEYKLAQQGYNKLRANLSTNYSNSNKYVTATKADLRKYLSPSSFPTNSSGKLQFLRIDKYRSGVTASELNAFFKKYAKSNSVFLNKGQQFIDAAKKYDLDVTYFVAASMLETGYGISQLAQGVYYETPSGSKVKVYNFFGIAAYDGSSVPSASAYAYKMGWTSIDKTIEGSAKWLANNYIHSTKYNQNTLYKMRWHYKTGHQYATDVNWANLIAIIMNRLVPYYENASLEYLIPNY